MSADKAAYLVISKILQRNIEGISVHMIAKESQLAVTTVRNTIRYFLDTHFIIDDVVYIKNHPLNAYLQRGFKPIGALPESTSSYVHRMETSKNIKHELRNRGPVKIQSSLRRFAIEEGA